MIFLLSEEAAADEKRGKLYKPKSRFEGQSNKTSFLPLETPPQFLAIDKRQVSTVVLNLPLVFAAVHNLCWSCYHDLSACVCVCVF